MKLEWLGRYRELVRALVYYSNSSNRGVVETARGGRTPITQHEYQVLEYLCEFEEENRIMTDISRDLGIAQSNITKAAKLLIQNGYAERYRIGSNRKNIVLKPTDEGRKLYLSMCQRVENAFLDFFSTLDSLSDEQLRTFEIAVRQLSNNWNDSDKLSSAALTKIDK